MIIAGVYTLIAMVVFLAIAIILRAFGLLANVMDDGDGQGGVPHERLTVRPQRERVAAQRGRCDRCSMDPEDVLRLPWVMRPPCTCPDDCYEAQCLAWARPPVPGPALGCRFCRPPFRVDADCTCSGPCEDPQCGALQWQAVASTEEWER